MNTPSSKPRKRFAGYYLKNPKERFGFGGNASGGLHNPQVAQALGEFIGVWAHLEESMIRVFSELIGDQTTAVGHAIFRSISAERLRLDIMRTLLTETPLNRTKEAVYDEVLEEFESLNKIRNDLVHGLWWTADKSKKTFIHTTDPAVPIPIINTRHISLKQVEAALKRAGALQRKIAFELVGPKLVAEHAKRSSQEKLSRPPDEADSSGKARRTKSKARQHPPQSSEA